MNHAIYLTLTYACIHSCAQQDFWHFDYAKVNIKSVVVHGKNDRKGGAHSTIEYDLPRGPLLKLMLAHITLGHALLTLEKGDRMVRLFVSAQGKEFSDSTFCQYWSTLMASTATGGITYFRPSLARTIFVEVGACNMHAITFAMPCHNLCHAITFALNPRLCPAL